MAGIILRNGRIVGDGETPYIVAEMNSSHNGKVERAIQMIDAAKECGCDCVKFQSWTADTLYSEEYYAQNPISHRMVKGFSLNENELLELWKHCKEIDIDFSSTPYSEQEVDFLTERAEVPFIKIASMEINNLSFLEYIARKNIPMMLSTGMASYDEIDRAVRVITDTGNHNLCILHCVSVYPAAAENIHLNNIVYLKERYPDFVIGYSDHTIGSEVACGAIALGAGVIEKHFTLDSAKMGMDNNMATEPEAMKDMVEKCHSVYRAMGSAERILSESEKMQQAKMRRSIVAKTDISEGTVITADMLECKRPGTGLEPSMQKNILGKKVNRSIKKGYMILEKDIAP